MSQKLLLQTTNIEIMNILEDVIETVIKLTKVWPLRKRVIWTGVRFCGICSGNLEKSLQVCFVKVLQNVKHWIVCRGKTLAEQLLVELSKHNTQNQQTFGHFVNLVHKPGYTLAIAMFLFYTFAIFSNINNFLIFG